MTSPALDPLRLPVASFAADAQTLSGEWPVSELPRLVESECPPDVVASAEERPRPGDGHRSPPEGIEASGKAASTREAAVADAARQVRWQAVGSSRKVGGEEQVWLALTAQVALVLQCQRCLTPLRAVVEVDRHFRFVADEAAAAALDEEIEDDVLVLQRALDLRELVEDELLLALPLVPRHDVCPERLPTSFGDVEEVAAAEAAAHPFASLALLRKDKDGDGGPDVV